MKALFAAATAMVGFAGLALADGTIIHSHAAGGAKVQPSKSYMTEASYNLEEGGIQSQLYVAVYPGSNGPEGYVYRGIADYNDSTYIYILCMGPAYAGALSFNGGTGDTIINVVLDADAEGCEGQGFTGPLIVTLSGRADGEYHDSSEGTGRTRYSSGFVNYTESSNNFSVVFEGSIGDTSGPFFGNASNTLRHEIYNIH